MHTDTVHGMKYTPRFAFFPPRKLCAPPPACRRLHHTVLALGHYTISCGFLTIAIPLEIVPLLDAPQIIQLEAPSVF